MLLIIVGTRKTAETRSPAMNRCTVGASNCGSSSEVNPRAMPASRPETPETWKVGAAPISPTLLRRAIDTFRCDFLQAFGAGTEAGLQSVPTPADHRRALAGAPHLLGSIGKPAFGVEMRIVDEAGSDVPRGQVGEIITRSDPVMAGYLEMPEETSRAIRDGWFWGGDLARMDDEGYLYLAGRSKDMIIRGGENIYPREVEDVLLEHPGVQGAAVVGRPASRTGRRRARTAAGSAC